MDHLPSACAVEVLQPFGWFWCNWFARILNGRDDIKKQHMKNADIWGKWQSVNPCDSRLLSGTELAPSVQVGSSLEGTSNSEDRGFSGW